MLRIGFFSDDIGIKFVVGSEVYGNRDAFLECYDVGLGQIKVH